MEEWFWSDRIDYWQPDGPLNSTVYDMNNRQEMLQNTYRIGARFLHELRNTWAKINSEILLVIYFAEVVFG